MKAICRVCELIDNDKTIKEVIYCDMCKASMCKPCEVNWLRRGEAAILEKQIKIKKMKTLNLILGVAFAITSCVAAFNDKLEVSLLFLILSKLYTDGSTNR
jgi:hypothetical protein